MSREERFEAGQASAIPRIRELEAKNVELEKTLVETEKAFEDKKRALTAAINMWDIEIKKLEIAKDVLNHIYETSDDKDSSKEAKQALAAIKGKG